MGKGHPAGVLSVEEAVQFLTDRWTSANIGHIKPCAGGQQSIWVESGHQREAFNSSRTNVAVEAAFVDGVKVLDFELKERWFWPLKNE